MKEGPPIVINNVDSLLFDFESATGERHQINEIDSMCQEIDASFQNRTQEITGMPVEKKRVDVLDSDDQHLLNLLSMDESFNVRVLSACNPKTPVASLRRLVEGSNDYVRMIVANNPSTPADLLDRIVELTSEKEVVDAVISHPNVSEVTKYKVGIKSPQSNSILDGDEFVEVNEAM